MELNANFVKLASYSVLSGLAAIVAGPQIAAASTIYDAQTYFASNNDSATAGPFAFGYINGGGFNLFPLSDDNVGNTGMDYFVLPGTTDPNFIFNDSGSAQSIAGFTLQPNQIGAGPAGGPVDLEFTAPSTGTYNVSATFQRIQFPANTDAEAAVDINGNPTPVFAMDASSTGVTYTDTLSLTAGDTVDFIVAGSNEGFGNATTSVSATLTLTPEPASLGLFGVGAFTLLVRRRRSL